MKLKLNSLNGWVKDDGEVEVSVAFIVVNGTVRQAIDGLADAIEVVNSGGKEAASQQQTAPTEAATSTRRRGASTTAPKEPEASPAQTSPPAEAPASTRRRRGTTEDKPPTITDADLTKAASLAAETLGTKVVAEILGEFNVKLTSEIPEAERQEFLDLLNGTLDDFKNSKAG